MSDRLSFTKLSATGNDFVLFDNRSSVLTGNETVFLAAICTRRTGIGADGVLLIEKSDNAHFRMRYFNADGRESEMCGNGARAAAFYAFHHGVAPIHCRFEVWGEMYEAVIEGKTVSLLMHPPADIDLEPGAPKQQDVREWGRARVGVPHYVLQTENLASTAVERIGKYYCEHAFFQPEGTNVNFVMPNVVGELEVRTYERGVNAETLSCGTGAVASAYVAHQRLDMAFPITIRTAGGTLTVNVDERTRRPTLYGEVRMPFTGDVGRP